MKSRPKASYALLIAELLIATVTFGATWCIGSQALTFGPGVLQADGFTPNSLQASVPDCTIRATPAPPYPPPLLPSTRSV